MNIKRLVVRKFIAFTDGWNKEVHDAIEEKVLTGVHQLFPIKPEDNLEQRDKIVSEAREFYFARMSVTANLLVAGAALIVALIALVVAVVALPPV